MRVEAEVKRDKTLKEEIFACRQVFRHEAHFSTMNCTATEHSSIRDKGCGEVMVIHPPSLFYFLSILPVSFGVILLFDDDSH